jgi:NAD(P)H-flavin reductase
MTSRSRPCPRASKSWKNWRPTSSNCKRLPANERLQFLAGQYIDILLKDGKKRSFSLANAPHDDALLQLHIRHVPGGQFTDQVFSVR